MQTSAESPRTKEGGSAAVAPEPGGVELHAGRTLTLIVLALLGTLFATVGLVIVSGWGYFDGSDHSRAHYALVAAIAAYPATFVGVFFDVAVAERRHRVPSRVAAETWRMHWRPAAAGQVAVWSLIAALVGTLLNQVARLVPRRGRIAVWLVRGDLGAGDDLRRSDMVIENVSPVDAVKRSSACCAAVGESLSGSLTIGAWTIVGILPAAIVAGIGVGMPNSSASSAPCSFAVGGVVIALAAGFASALRQVFAVALYRYATGGDSAQFAAEDLERPVHIPQAPSLASGRLLSSGRLSCGDIERRRRGTRP